MSLRGNTSSLKAYAQKLRALPRVVALKVTTSAAPALTKLGRATFDASQDAYGVPWAPGVDGQKITLRKSGALAKFLAYVGIGTKLRVALGVPYAKYQIGKRPVFPAQGKALPTAYVTELASITEKTARAAIGGGS